MERCEKDCFSIFINQSFIKRLGVKVLGRELLESLIQKKPFRPTLGFNGIFITVSRYSICC